MMKRPFDTPVISTEQGVEKEKKCMRPKDVGSEKFLLTKEV